jgi:hypothetical protein
MSDYDRFRGSFFMGQSKIKGNIFYRNCLKASKVEHKIDERRTRPDRRSPNRTRTSLTEDRRKKYSYQNQFYDGSVQYGRIINHVMMINVVIHNKKFAIKIKLERKLSGSELQLLQCLIVGYIFATDIRLLREKMPKILFWQGIQNIVATT